jgi:hypothetical protein
MNILYYKESAAETFKSMRMKRAFKCIKEKPMMLGIEQVVLSISCQLH